jgi:phospholipid transport system transporter-binding protein
MPSPSSKASVERVGETLRFAGALTREAVAPLWAAATRLLDGVHSLDLRDVPRVDSAGVALLAELAAGIAPPPSVLGAPEGYQALCAAYRLGATLAFT